MSYCTVSNHPFELHVSLEPGGRKIQDIVEKDIPDAGFIGSSVNRMDNLITNIDLSRACIAQSEPLKPVFWSKNSSTLAHQIRAGNVR
jgi:hypothetical protein